MPRPHLFLRRPRPFWHFFLIGSILSQCKTACDYHAFANECVKDIRLYLKDGDCESALSSLNDLEYASDGMHAGAVSLERRCQAYRESIESLGFTRSK